MTDYDTICEWAELRVEDSFMAGLIDVHPNEVNGLVEIFLDRAMGESAVVNLRFTPAQARALGEALLAAATNAELLVLDEEYDHRGGD
jgi:hypothetical protein